MKKIAITGPVGYETAKAIYNGNKLFLDRRFPKFWLKEFLENTNGSGKACIEDVESLAEDSKGTEKNPEQLKSGQTWIEIAEGGLFGALWIACEQEKAEGKSSGCEVYIEKVPILQEVVEICELFDVNPYEASSKGVFLIVEEEEQIRKYGGQLKIIGTMCSGKDRVIVMKDKETRRFLTPPRRQAKDMANR